MFASLRLPLMGLLSFTLTHAALAAECTPDQGHGAQVFANECAVCHSAVSYTHLTMPTKA